MDATFLDKCLCGGLAVLNREMGFHNNYTCSECGIKGPKAVDEPLARHLWNQSIETRKAAIEDILYRNNSLCSQNNWSSLDYCLLNCTACHHQMSCRSEVLVEPSPTDNKNVIQQECRTHNYKRLILHNEVCFRYGDGQLSISRHDLRDILEFGENHTHVLAENLEYILSNEKLYKWTLLSQCGYKNVSFNYRPVSKHHKSEASLEVKYTAPDAFGRKKRNSFYTFAMQDIKEIYDFLISLRKK